MRVWTVPALLVGIFAVTNISDEPSEAAMQRAFQATLAGEVRAALDFVAENNGEAGVEKIRAARTDAFDILGFNKLACAASLRGPGHVCGFSVRIGVATGEIDCTITGRFYEGPHGLEFVEAIAAGV